MAEAAMPPDAERAGDALILAGERLVADPSGGLYWPAADMLVIADLHLEKGAAYAEKGVMLPPYDTPDTIGIVEMLVARYRPATVVALGDSFHRPDSQVRLPTEMGERIAAFIEGRRWIWIAGNHDPAPPVEWGGEALDEIAVGPITLRHEPRAGPAWGEIAGHLHPVARLCARGRFLRRRCFVADGDRLVMPALGAYAGGLNVLDPAFAFAFPSGRFHAWMLGRSRVYPIPPSRLVADPR